MKFDLENIFKKHSDEEYDKWKKLCDDLIEEYWICVDTIEIDGHEIELWCYDDDLSALFTENGIGLGRSFNVEKVFNFDEDFQPVGLDYGDYIETVEFKQNGNTYFVPVYCADNGCGADYAFALFEAERGADVNENNYINGI